MSHGELAYLILVLSAFVIFIAVVGFFSTSSGSKRVAQSPDTSGRRVGPTHVRFG